jgi:FtsZ-binding cell division protein ZapB
MQARAMDATDRLHTLERQLDEIHSAMASGGDVTHAQLQNKTQQVVHLLEDVDALRERHDQLVKKAVELGGRCERLSQGNEKLRCAHSTVPSEFIAVLAGVLRLPVCSRRWQFHDSVC